MWDPKSEVDYFLSLGLSDEENRKILYQNAQKLFGIELWLKKHFTAKRSAFLCVFSGYCFGWVLKPHGFLLNLHPTAPLGVLLSLDTKQSNEKPNWQGLLRCISALTASEMLAMEQPLLCFHPCQNKNTTQNPLAPPTFHRLPKNRFFIRRIWKPNFPFAGEKGKYRLPMRLRLGSSSLTFQLEKIRLNSKLSVKIV